MCLNVHPKNHVVISPRYSIGYPVMAVGDVQLAAAMNSLRRASLGRSRMSFYGASGSPSSVKAAENGFAAWTRRCGSIQGVSYLIGARPLGAHRQLPGSFQPFNFQPQQSLIRLTFEATSILGTHKSRVMAPQDRAAADPWTVAAQEKFARCVSSGLAMPLTTSFEPWRVSTADPFLGQQTQKRILRPLPRSGLEEYQVFAQKRRRPNHVPGLLRVR